MALTIEQIKPKDLCQLEGCYTHVKNKRRKYCSRECHEKAIGARIPKCQNPACNNRVKRGRNHYCSWDCYKVDNNKNAHDTCQRVGCCNTLTSRKSTRKYCSQECYKLDKPNRPSRKKVRLCTLPECGKQIKRRGNGRKFCSVECSVKSRKKLTPTNCPTCDTQFSPKRLRQIFCSEKCRRGEVKLTIKKVSGLPRRFTKVDKKWVLTAKLTWQETHGEIPKGMNVWFKDSEWFNDMDINNLYLVEHKEYLGLIEKVTQLSSEAPMAKGKYEGREEKENSKEEFVDHNQEFF
jgi:hypothetical protein